MKKISIVLPFYNAGKYLAACLDSLLSQSYENFEIIAVDDGSTDDSGDILKKYCEADKRISYHHIPHGNVSIARNFAIGKISGEYVTFLDADDWCEKDYLIELMSSMEESGSDLSACGCREISGKKVVERYLEDFEPSLLDKDGSAENLMVFLSEKNVMSACWCKLYKTKIIREKDICFSVEAFINGDIIFNMEYLLHCNHVSFVRLPLYNYVKHSASLSSKRDPDAIMSIEKVLKGKREVLDRSRLPVELIESTLVHWKFRALAFACYREMTSTERFGFRERLRNSRELAKMVRNMMKSGEIDFSRVKSRTMLFVRFLYMVNGFTLLVLLTPVHLYTLFKRGE